MIGRSGRCQTGSRLSEVPRVRRHAQHSDGRVERAEPPAGPDRHVVRINRQECVKCGDGFLGAVQILCKNIGHVLKGRAIMRIKFEGALVIGDGALRILLLAFQATDDLPRSATS